MAAKTAGGFWGEYSYPMDKQGYTVNGNTCWEYGNRGNGSAINFSAKNVGSYTITIIGFTNNNDSSGKASNYKWASNSDTNDERKLTFTVAQKELTFHADITGQTYTYSGQSGWEDRAKCNVTGMVGSEKISFLFPIVSGAYMTSYDLYSWAYALFQIVRHESRT